MEKPLATPLYHLLLQKYAALLLLSGGGVFKHYGSFGWVLGTEERVLWECKGIARGYQMHFYQAEGYGRISLLLFLTHYLR
jgi:hypothetical protein